MYQKDGMYVLKGWMYFIRSCVNQLQDQFQLAVSALMTVLATGRLVSARCKGVMNVLAPSFKFEPKPENPKKPKAQIFLN